MAEQIIPNETGFSCHSCGDCIYETRTSKTEVVYYSFGHEILGSNIRNSGEEGKKHYFCSGCGKDVTKVVEKSRKELI